jgi:hypothetical protein
MFCSQKQMHPEEKGGTLKLIVVKSCNCHKTRMLKKWVLLLLLSLLPDAASTTPEKPECDVAIEERRRRKRRRRGKAEMGQR